MSSTSFFSASFTAFFLSMCVQLENEQSRREVIVANQEQMDRKKAVKEAEKKEVDDMLKYQGR